MGTAVKHLTPLELIRAIELLTDAEKETLAILADKELSEEILRRRRDALDEMKSGQLLGVDELFKKD
ncbi:MAG: hypothetical protein HY805_10805 [Nitrospirae bacterium]|nr:hypothetical protein [Nitrospirota bacterium]